MFVQLFVVVLTVLTTAFCRHGCIGLVREAHDKHRDCNAIAMAGENGELRHVVERSRRPSTLHHRCAQPHFPRRRCSSTAFFPQCFQ